MDILNNIVEQLSQLAEAPNWAMIAHLVVIVLVVMWVIMQIRREIRKAQWMAMSPQERRQVIWDILNEAWDTAEWLFSNIELKSTEGKQAVAAKKLQTATNYADRELIALGAGWDDRMTIKTRIEAVGDVRNAGKQRYKNQPRNPRHINNSPAA